MASIEQIVLEYSVKVDKLKAELGIVAAEMTAIQKKTDDAAKKMSKGFKEAGKTIDDTARSTRALGNTLQKTSSDFGAVSRSAQNLRLETKKLDNEAVKPLASTFDNLKQRIAVALSVGALIAFGKEAIVTSAKVEGLNTQLAFITGSSEAGEAAMSKLRLMTDRLGLEFVSTASAYTKFAGAATQSGLAMEEVDRIFENVAIAGKAMNLTAEETSGIFIALQQMISKGTVAAEELRGQMGERLPGAFSIAAKSMGLTEAALNDMLVKGEVVAKEFLPAFSEQLRSTFEGAMGDASESTTSNLNRMTNAWTEFKLVVGNALSETIVPGMTLTFQALANFINDDAVETMGEHTEALKKSIKETERYIELVTKHGDEIGQQSNSIIASAQERISALKGDTQALLELQAELHRVYAIDTQREGESTEVRNIAVTKALEQIDALIKSASTKKVEETKYNKLSIKELEALDAAGDKLARAELKRRKDAVVAAEKYNDWVQKNIDAVGDWAAAQLKLNDALTAFPVFMKDETLTRNMENYAEIWNKLYPVVNRTNQRLNDISHRTKEVAEDQQIDNDDRLKEEAEAAKAREESQLRGLEFTSGVISAIDQLYTDSNNYQLGLLEQKLELGLITEQEYQRERKKLLKKQAQEEKLMTLFQIAIQTARSIVEASPDPGRIGAAIILGLIQAGVVAAKPIPAFKKGKIDIDGEGNSTSDSILARISKGESVLNAKATKKYKPLLQAANDLKAEELILNTYLLPVLRKALGAGGGASVFDDSGMIRATEEVIRTSRQNTKQIVKALESNENIRRNW